MQLSNHTYLTNHDGEDEDSNEVVDELEDDLKQGGGIRQTADGDQSFHCKVVTANITEARRRRKEEEEEEEERSERETLGPLVRMSKYLLAAVCEVTQNMGVNFQCHVFIMSFIHL